MRFRIVSITNELSDIDFYSTDLCITKISDENFNKNEISKQIKKSIIEFDLEKKYEEISKISEMFFLNTKILKNNIDIIEIILNANINNNLHFENINIFEKYYDNIECDSKYRKRLLSLFLKSFIKENKIKEALPILKILKKYDNTYYSQYINCLIKSKNYKESLIELKKFFPNDYHKKIFKEIKLCEVFFNLNELEKLSKQIIKTKKIFHNYRIFYKDLPENKIFYKLGIFSLHIGKNINAIKFFHNSATLHTQFKSDKIYKNNSIKKLKELNINIKI